MYVDTLGPIDPYHQARALRRELAELPPYPGTTAAYTTLGVSLVNFNSRIEVNYASNGQCSDIQAYYVTTAAAAWWTKHGPLRTLHHDSNPDHDELDSEYRKTAQGYPLELVIACFVDSSYQGDYYLSIQAPP